jgi:hypothetical protein
MNFMDDSLCRADKRPTTFSGPTIDIVWLTELSIGAMEFARVVFKAPRLGSSTEFRASPTVPLNWLVTALARPGADATAGGSNPLGIASVGNPRMSIFLKCELAIGS